MDTTQLIESVVERPFRNPYWLSAMSGFERQVINKFSLNDLLKQFSSLVKLADRPE